MIKGGKIFETGVFLFFAAGNGHFALTENRKHCIILS